MLPYSHKVIAIVLRVRCSDTPPVAHEENKTAGSSAATDGVRRKTEFSVRGAETAAAPEQTTRHSPQILNVKSPNHY